MKFERLRRPRGGAKKASIVGAALPPAPRFWPVLPLLYCAVIAGPFPAEAARPATVRGDKAMELGLVRILCTSEDGFELRTRGTLLDPGPAAAANEIVLTSAHGLPAEVSELTQRCVVVGRRGREYRIETAWVAEPLRHGLADDWAVLRTERRMRGDLRRVRAAPMDRALRERMAAATSPVRLPLLHPPAEQGCRLTGDGLSNAEKAAGLFAHTCRAWQGHSGSPILAGDELQLIGFHLGTRWVVEDRKTLKLGRYLDAQILDAIAAAARGHARPNALAASASD